MTGPEYKKLNQAVLIIVLAGLALPVVFVPISRFLPVLATCPSIVIFHHPCPLCGITRGIYSLMHGNISKAQNFNILTIPVLCAMLAETVFRIFLISTNRKESILKVLAKFDLMAHVTAFAGYCAYAAWFFLFR